MSDPDSAQRRFALEVVARLRGAGHEALWAGGCVRDELLGATPKDYDIATSAHPEAVRELFGHRRTVAVGAAFGVITVLGQRGAGPIEVATFRSEEGYADGRRPDQVRFTDAREDALRRDFTINGLFYDPVDERVIDFVGGRPDLEARVVRAIGRPDERFGEDKLRMLRAVRFASTLAFDIDDQTLAAVQAHAPEIQQVSAERIGAELRRMLVDARRATALRLLAETGLLRFVLPEVASFDAESFERVTESADRLREPSFAAALVAVLWRHGDSLQLASLAERLRLTNKERDSVAWLFENLPTIGAAPDLRWPALQRVLRLPGAKELIALYEATCGADEASRYCRAKIDLPIEELDPEPLVNGGDLIKQGVRPGPALGQILESVRDAQLECRVRTKADALRLVRELSEGSVDETAP